VLDDDRRKTMPAIGDRGHARSLRRTPPNRQAVFLTMPTDMIIGYLIRSIARSDRTNDGARRGDAEFREDPPRA